MLGGISIQFDTKYVLHVPEYKHSGNQLIHLDMDTLMDDLINQLNINGYENLYVQKVKGYYKKRSFDEQILTIFVSKDLASKQNQKLPNTIFKEWFVNNNNILEQESFAYEENNNLFVEELK